MRFRCTSAVGIDANHLWTANVAGQSSSAYGPVTSYRVRADLPSFDCLQLSIQLPHASHFSSLPFGWFLEQVPTISAVSVQSPLTTTELTTAYALPTINSLQVC